MNHKKMFQECEWEIFRSRSRSLSLWKLQFYCAFDLTHVFSDNSSSLAFDQSLSNYRSPARTCKFVPSLAEIFTQKSFHRLTALVKLACCLNLGFVCVSMFCLWMHALVGSWNSYENLCHSHFKWEKYILSYIALLKLNLFLFIIAL